MRSVIGLFALAVLGSTSAYGQDQIGESCTGTETLKVGAGVAKVIPYQLTFSADLATGYYCYAECRPEQTYAIKDRASEPIKLAEVNGDQPRLTTFDRKKLILNDYQVIRVMGKIERRAKATCRATAFHKPTPLPGD